MPFFRNLPVQRKLMALTMTAAVAAMLGAHGAFITCERAAARTQMARTLDTTAGLIAANIQAGSSFEPPERVEQVLKSLSLQPDIVAACVYDQRGQPLARYLRNGPDRKAPPPVAPGAGWRFQGGTLELSHPVGGAGRFVGAVFIREDSSRLTTQLWRCLLIASLGLVGFGGVAFFVSTAWQRLVSNPLSELARAVAEVRKTKDYSMRVARQGGEELGSLIDSFNDMLTQIQERDSHLEKRVAERTRAEQKLAESKHFLDQIINTVADPIFVKDRLHRGVLVNDAFCQLMGCGREYLIGKSDHDQKSYSAGEADEFRAKDDAVFTTGQENINEEMFTDVGGHPHILITKKRLYVDEKGEPFIVGVIRDVTESKRAEQALRESEANYYSLVDQMPAGIFRKNKEGRYIIVNSWFCRFRGGQPEDYLGKLPQEVAAVARYGPGMPVAGLVAHFTAGAEHHLAIMRDGRQIEVEEEYRRADGKAMYHHVVKSPVFGPDGAVAGSQGIMLDITSIKEAEARLKQAHQQLVETSRLAGMAEVATSVLHNVGNVLNSVNVSATLVLDQVRKSRLNHFARLAALIQEQRDQLATFFTTDPRGKQLPEYLTKLAEHLAAERAELVAEIELIRKNVDHIKDVVTMQQNYAKVSGVAEKINAAELVEEALRMNADALRRHQVQVVRDYPPAAIEGHLQRHRLLQILVNLIRNADQACAESGRPDKRMTLQVRADGGRVQFSVRDNGVGIPAENMTRIFNHGFTTRADGHGFGLHSGALAAKELGGALTVHSDGPGAGARFVLELPLQPPQKS